MSAPLSGVRLGVLERSLLVNAPMVGTSGGLIIHGLEPRSSAQTGYLRAAKKLAAHGLVRRYRLRVCTRARDPRRASPRYEFGHFWRDPDPTRSHLSQRVVLWSTPFGEGIKLIYEWELKTGSAIRWTETKLALARRYEDTHWCNPQDEENAVDLVESLLMEDGHQRPKEKFKEVLPDPAMTDHAKQRWRRAVRVAKRENPKLGSCSLWRAAEVIYRSDEDDEHLGNRAGPPINPPKTISPLRFKNVGLA